MLKLAKRTVLLTPAFAILLPLAAQAAPPPFWRDYAAAAVRQVMPAAEAATRIIEGCRCGQVSIDRAVATHTGHAGRVRR